MSSTVSSNLLQEATARHDAVRQAIVNTVNNRPKSDPTVEKISVRHLNFYYQDGNHALRDVSVPIYDNRVTAFMGPSGRGKSTLLRVFSRIHDLYPGQRAEGEVLLDGTNILGPTDVYQLRTRIGMVFQKPTPFPMTSMRTSRSVSACSARPARPRWTDSSRPRCGARPCGTR